MILQVVVLLLLCQQVCCIELTISSDPLNCTQAFTSTLDADTCYGIVSCNYNATGSCSALSDAPSCFNGRAWNGMLGCVQARVTCSIVENFILQSDNLHLISFLANDTSCSTPIIDYGVAPDECGPNLLQIILPGADSCGVAYSRYEGLPDPSGDGSGSSSSSCSALDLLFWNLAPTL